MRHKHSPSIKFLTFFAQAIDNCPRMGTARNYSRTLASFSNFLNGHDIAFSALDSKLMERYEYWLTKRGVVRNTSSFYMRNLRAVYNKAVMAGIARQNFPFVHVYTGIDRTRKRAIDERVVARLHKLDLSCSKTLSLARDLFIFSYGTRGMAFVDIAYLRKADIDGNTLSYVRRKTGQRMSVHLEPCVLKIIERYARENAGSRYVFPIITSLEPMEAYKQYYKGLNEYNRQLKRLASLIDNGCHLSSYTARHTWATSARKHNIPISIISAGMGHTSEKTTQIYLAELDSSLIDQANRNILKGLSQIRL